MLVQFNFVTLKKNTSELNTNQPQFWDNKYISSETKWDIAQPTPAFVEYFQSEINKEIKAATNGRKEHSIEDKLRLITMVQKIQRLSTEAHTTLNNLEDDILTFIEQI